MVSQIQLGNFFSANGRTVLGGVGGSGLDTQALITALVNAKTLPATRLQTQIAGNSAKAAAFSEFQQLLNKIKDASNFLRNPPGVGNAADNVFKYTKANVTSNSSVTGSTYMTVSTAPGAQIQSYTINEITSLASAKVQRTGNINIATADSSAVSSSPDPGLFKTGTFTLNGEAITLEEGDSLNTVASKINAVSGDTGISASIIKVENGVYQLSLSATSSGTLSDFDLNNVDVPGTLDDPDDVFGLGEVDRMVISDSRLASDAEFILNGATIIRQSNNISDVIDGLTFTLWQVTPTEEPATELTVSVQPDSALIKSGVLNFINAYNDLRVFAAKQQRVNSDGTYAEGALLGSDPTLRTVLNDVNNQLSAISSKFLTGTPPKAAVYFSDLPESAGNPKVRNILTYDDGLLDSLIATNLEQVRTAFEFDFITSNPNLKVFSRTNALTAASFTLTANPFATQTTGIFEITDADTAGAVSATPTVGYFKPGTLTVNGVDIVLTDGMTLNEAVQAFNDETGTTGLAASIVEVEAGKFKIVFTSTPLGGNINYNLKASVVDPSNVLQQVTMTSTASFTADVPGHGIVTFDSQTVGGGYSLSAPEDSPLSGLVLVYGSTLTSTSSLSTSQGIADKLYNNVNATLDPFNGTLSAEFNRINASNVKLTSDIVKINEEAVRLRDQLLFKFGALEQAIARVNTLLQSLEAYDLARQNSNN